MSFSPFIVGQGLQAWRLLKRTQQTQLEAFAATGEIARQSNHFRETASSVTTPSELVDDRAMRSVVLGAYGLSADMESKFFIRKIMSDGTDDPGALSKKLSDQRYKQLAADFDFARGTNPKLRSDAFIDRVIQRFQSDAFETVVGKSDNALRLGLYFERSFSDVARKAPTDTAGWFQVLGTPPLREVLAKSLGFPDAFFKLDIDVQLDRMKQKARQVFGTDQLSDLSQPGNTNRIIERFLVRDQLTMQTVSSGYQTALSILTAGPRFAV